MLGNGKGGSVCVSDNNGDKQELSTLEQGNAYKEQNVIEKTYTMDFNYMYDCKRIRFSLYKTYLLHTDGIIFIPIKSCVVPMNTRTL